MSEVHFFWAAGYTEYRGVDFFARDDALQFWLFIVAEEIDADPTTPDWLRQAGGGWRAEAMWEAGDLLNVKFDPPLTHPQRAMLLAQVFGRSLDRVCAFGDPVPGTVLCELNLSGCGTWWLEKEIRIEAVLRVGRAYTRLIAGTLTVPSGGMLFV